MAAKTKEERIELIEQKIAKKKEEIANLEAQKQKLLHPVTMRAVLTKAKEAGLSPEDVAEKLGLDMEE
jgi:cell division protein FtsL